MYKEQIRNFYEQLSPGYRRIADYLLNHYQDAAFMTAAEIGRAVQVDTALVVRFAQRLGYPGFPELSADLQEEVKRDLRAVYEPPEGSDAPEHIFRHSLLQDRNNVEYMLLHLDDASVLEAIALFQAASRIFVIGEGNLSYFAEAFATRLVTLGFPAHVFPAELTGQAAVVGGLTPADLVVAVSMTAMNPGVAAVVRQARAIGARTLGIVPSLTHPVAAAAQHIVHAPVYTAGIIPSWVTAAAVLHAFSQVLALNTSDRSAQWVMRTDHFLTMYENVLKNELTGVRAQIAEYNVTART